MTFPTVFANLPGSPSTNPASLIDTMFSLCGAMGVIPCTASGTNAITVTPNVNYYLPTAYANYQAVAFVAANNATGAVTIQIGTLGFVNLYMPSGVQANSGDINAGVMYVALYNGALNTGAGGFQVFNATTPSVVQPIQGGFKNLQVTNGGTPTTQIAVTADQVMLQTTGGGSFAVRSVNLTISTGVSGVNGLDAGSVASATWYAVYVISNGSVTAGLISTSATSPTLPIGYIYFARVGYMRTAGASTNLLTSLQIGNRAQWVITASGTIQNTLVVTSGVVGTYSATSPVLASVSIANFVPPTAQTFIGVASNGYQNNAASNGVMVAPNSHWGGTNNGPEGSNGNIFPVWVQGVQGNVPFQIVLESTSLFMALSDTGKAVGALGWTDNLP